MVDELAAELLGVQVGATGGSLDLEDILGLFDSQEGYIE
jgi:hypothetical protein